MEAPVIDRKRSESRPRLHSRPSSRASSPNRDSPSQPSSPVLRSALKHLHQIDSIDYLPLPQHLEESNSIYERRVGFDSFDTDLPTAGHSTGLGVSTSFSISAKSRHYTRATGCRTFIVCTDLKAESWHAIEWTLASLAEDGDELVILRVIEPESKAGKIYEERPEEVRSEADDTLERVMRANVAQVSISIIVEFVVGLIEESIHRMIEVYRADTLIVGTRGKTDRIFSRKYMGSISRYCVAKSPIPVVVVRPEDRVKESITARRADPEKYGAYVSLLGETEREGGRRLARPQTAPEQEERGRSLSHMRAQTSAGV